jgi:antitoxin HicB
VLLYPATIRPDGDTFVVLFPNIPNTHTNGKSREDVLLHAPDALQLGIFALMEKNLDIPLPGKARGKQCVLVGLPSVVSSAKVELYMALRASGVRKAELARRMGIHKQQVERLLDLSHASRIEQLEAAFKALQMQLVVDIRSAA